MLKTTFANHELKCLDMHEKLALIIICTTGIDGSFADLRFKRI